MIVEGNFPVTIFAGREKPEETISNQKKVKKVEVKKRNMNRRWIYDKIWLHFQEALSAMKPLTVK